MAANPISKPISHYLPPALLLLSTVLAAANWYLQPARGVTWATAVLLVGCLTLVFLLIPRGAQSETARTEHGLSISSGIVWAGLIVAGSLGAKLATTLGAVDDRDVAQRIMMAILGGFLVFTGNAIPKKLTPLSAQWDAARVQAFQRFAGWTWVLAGLALAIAWLVVPVGLAGTITMLLLPSAILIIAVQAVRLHRTRPRAA